MAIYWTEAWGVGARFCPSSSRSLVARSQSLQGLSMSPEEEEELRRVEKWVEMMAEMDTEEEAMMQAWMRPRSGSSS